MAKQRKHIFIGDKRFDEVILTEKQCAQYATKWKSFVGLADWNIQLKIVPRSGMELKDAQAEVFGSELRQLAFINILSPDEYNPGPTQIPQNMEKSIIHELTHISLYPFNLTKELLDEEEKFIEKQSHAFYELTQGRLP